MVVLLDTCFLIDLANGNQGAVKLLDELERDRTPLLVPSVALLEYLNGWRDARAALAGVERAAEVIDFASEDAAEATRLTRESLKKGRYPGYVDTIIAATSIARGGIPIVTRNGKHFPGCETRTY